MLDNVTDKEVTWYDVVKPMYSENIMDKTCNEEVLSKIELQKTDICIRKKDSENA